MTDTPGPRIEAVAKLLFTGVVWGYNAGDWEEAPGDKRILLDQQQCLMAAEDVLRGIDQAAVIASEEALAALPVGSVIRDGIGTLERMDHPEFMWRQMGGPDCAPHHGVTLPARLLWTPET
jgi:hypothetical protein